MTARFELASTFQPAGDQPQAIDKLVAGFRDGQPCQILHGRHRHRQDIHRRQRHRQHRQADAGPVPQQDAGRPALQGVSRLLPAQRRPLFHQLLRLLSARSLHPAARHLHRKGRRDQREHRPPAPGRHQRPGQPRGRHHRRQRLVHLRPGFAQRLQAHDGPPDQGRDRSTAISCCCKLVDIQYERNDVAFERGKFRVRGDVIEVWPAYEEYGLRIELFGDEVDALAIINPISGETLQAARRAVHLPGQALRHAGGAHPARPSRASAANWRSGWPSSARKASCSKRSGWRPAPASTWKCCWRSATVRASRTTPAGSAAASRASRRTRCIDFFPEDFLMIVDESHVTLPQVRGMFAGDHSRKTTLVEHGFRLPSALDNRPLRFDEWEKRRQAACCSCRRRRRRTNWSACGGEVVEQVIRPTGLVDPVLHVRPARGQVPDLIERDQETGRDARNASWSRR